MFISRVRILAALLAASSATPIMAQDSVSSSAETENSNVAESVSFAKEMMADSTAALTDETASEMERLANFQTVLANGLALDTIGRFMLGEERQSMSEEQIARYEAIFPNYITKLYAEQFNQIVGKPLEVIDAKAIGEHDVIVRTQFERKDDSPIMVDWRIRQLRSGERKAIDIIVAGVSIMLVKREEFSSFIAANGVDALLNRLEAEAG